jgi:alanine racemase
VSGRVADGGVRRRAVALVDLAAISANVATLKSALQPGTRLCAVVKADGYGHGAAEAARAALAGGAQMLAVAGAVEAAQLRAAGLTDAPLLVMGALSELELPIALGADAEVVIWRERDVDAVAGAGGGRVHVKLDTGMGRLGTRDADVALRVVEAADAARGVELAGVMTHFATADDDGDRGFFDQQWQRFGRWVAECKATRPELIAHAANSAATLRDPRSHFDMVRCGVAIYGLDPFGDDPDDVGLVPALELRSYVAEVKRCRAGESVGYGRRFVAERDQPIAVLPIGYGDGWRRALSDGSDVLIAGQRWPLVGTVSMDNATVSLADAHAYGIDAEALIGSEAVLIGRDGEQRITAEEVARRIGTINYEVTCGLTARVPRVYRDRAAGRDAAEEGSAHGEDAVGRLDRGAVRRRATP